jgi:hypothetical protein
MTIFEDLLFDSQMTLTSIAFLEEESTSSMEPYVVELGLVGSVPGQGEFQLNYHSPTPSPGCRTSGDFSGVEGITRPDETSVEGVARGIWRRDGQIMKLFVLSNQSDGTQNLRLIDIPLQDNTDRIARVVSYLI